MQLEIFYFKPRRENLTGLLFCLDLSLSRSTDHRDRNFYSLSHRFQSSCSWVMQLDLLYFVFCLSINMKNRTQCHKDKKGIKKEVTGLVSVPVSKTLVNV